ncbi:MAG TPA: hypothetical protein VNG53_11515 [Bacteroidia bacterium]|nr:hypothetical protein [Bacteroidia bacterium]
MKKLLIPFFILFIILFFSCTSSKTNDTNKNNQNIDSSLIQKNQKKSLKSSSKKSTYEVLKKQILGVWAFKSDLVTDFEIRKDSIYYIDQDKSYKYFLTKDDTLIIYFNGYTTKNLITIKKDNLMMLDSDTNQLMIKNNSISTD